MRGAIKIISFFNPTMPCIRYGHAKRGNCQRIDKWGDVAADLLLDYGVVVSPIIENREYYRANAQTLPFFRNIEREGVRISA